MTEDQAKEKWCPFVSNPVNSKFDHDEYCIASDCMAWRKAYKVSETETSGYCGLAGKP